MQKKSVSVKLKGMNKDLSRSTINTNGAVEFAQEIVNARLTPDDDDNSYGSMQAEPVYESVKAQHIKVMFGSCNIDKYVVYVGIPFLAERGKNVITVEYTLEGGSTKRDIIYLTDDIFNIYNDLTTEGMPKHKIDFVPSYENSKNINVYCVSGNGSPVIKINIADYLQGGQDYEEGTAVNGIITAIHTDIPSSYFVASPDVRQRTNISNPFVITRNAGGGQYANGTVQFAYSVVKNNVESNILEISPLYYNSVYADRASEPDVTEGGCSYKITIKFNPQDFYSIDKCVIYSIYRPTKDCTPIVRRKICKFDIIEETASASSTIQESSLIDEDNPAYARGGSGSIEDKIKIAIVTFLNTEEQIDSSILTTKNNKILIAHTACQKDGTLFLGNYNFTSQSVPEFAKSANITTATSSFSSSFTTTTDGYKVGSLLKYSSWDVSTFKANEKYRYGYQIMDKYGHWSDPVEIENTAPTSSVKPTANNSTISKVEKRLVVTSTESGFTSTDYRIRPVIIFPKASESKYKCQGIVYPTVFNEKARLEGGSHVMSSMCMRNISNGVASIATQPEMLFIDHPGYNAVENNVSSGLSRVVSSHMAQLPPACNTNAEFAGCMSYYNRQLRNSIIAASTTGASTKEIDPDAIRKTDNTKFFVDASIMQFLSPDVNVTDSPVSDGTYGISFVCYAQQKAIRAIQKIVASSPWTASVTNIGQQKTVFTEGSAAAIAIIGAKRLLTTPNWISGWKKADTDYATNWGIYPFQREYIQFNQGKEAEGNYDFENGKIEKKYTSNLVIANMTSLVTASVSPVSDVNVSLFTGLNDSIPITVGSDTKIYDGNVDIAIAPNGSSTWLTLPNNIKSKVSLAFEFVNVKADHSYLWIYTQMISPANDVISNALAETDKKWHSPGLPMYFGDAVEWSGMGEFFHIDGMTQSDIKYRLFECDAEYYRIITPTSTEARYKLGVPTWKNDQIDDLKIIPKSYIVNLKYKQAPHLVLSLPKTISSSVEYDQVLRPYAPLYDADAYIVSYPTTLYGYNGVTKNFVLPGTLKNTDLDTLLRVKKLMTGLAPLEAGFIIVDIVDNSITDTTINVDSTTPWIVAGSSVGFSTDSDGKLKALLTWKQGDWFFNRVELLGTYCESDAREQYNEIVVVPLESRTNMMGRYDILSCKPSIYARPDTFNKINYSYSQLPNFFTYYQKDEYTDIEEDYANRVTYTTTKVNGDKVDTWGTLTGLSYLDMDADKGKVTALTTFKNEIYCVQDRGIANILFNSRTQLSTESGIPIEVANSGKVDGKVYLYNNKGSLSNSRVLSTDDAIYILDDYNKAMYAVNSKTPLVSEQCGFYSYFKNQDFNNLLLLHDTYNSRTLICSPNNYLAFNERYNSFESFYSKPLTTGYINNGNRHLLFSFGNFYDYNNPKMLYGIPEYEAMSIKLLVSPTGMYDRCWDTIDMFSRRDELRDSIVERQVLPPFDVMRCYNDYQDSNEIDIENSKPYNGPSGIASHMFNQWHYLIPKSKQNGSIKRSIVKPSDPMRSPYLTIELSQKLDTINRCRKTSVDDIQISYRE